MIYSKMYWENIILAHEYDYIIGVPCSFVKELFEVDCIPVIMPAREDDAIGLAAGLVVGGKKPLVVVQSSGYPHCINAVKTLLTPYNIKMDILISCRAGLNESNPVQLHMIDFVLKSVQLLDVKVFVESDYNGISNIFDCLESSSTNVILKGI